MTMMSSKFYDRMIALGMPPDVAMKAAEIDTESHREHVKLKSDVYMLKCAVGFLAAWMMLFFTMTLIGRSP